LGQQITMTAKRKQNGFTLIELLLVVALMSLAVGVTGDILISLVRSYSKSQVINEIEQNANFVSQKLTKELRNATQIVRLNPVGDSPPNVSDSFNEIEFTDHSGSNNIIYKVTAGGVITRDNGDGNGDQNLTINNLASGIGVTVSCRGGLTACFTLIGDAPQVIQISLTFEQAGSPSSTIFKGEIIIEDTIVIRDTY